MRWLLCLHQPLGEGWVRAEVPGVLQVQLEQANNVLWLTIYLEQATNINLPVVEAAEAGVGAEVEVEGREVQLLLPRLRHAHPVVCQVAQ